MLEIAGGILIALAVIFIGLPLVAHIAWVAIENWKGFLKGLATLAVCTFVVIVINDL